jgi:hypothetical protein
MPRIWIYPRTLEAPSPSKAPSSPPTKKKEGTSASGKSDTSEVRLREFSRALKKLDKHCRVPGCKASSVMAAHIIPHRQAEGKGEVRRLPSQVWPYVGRDRFSCKRGDPLANDHGSFDRFEWTVNPRTGKVMTRRGAPSDIAKLDKKPFHFDHRAKALRPSKALWSLYNFYLFRDCGAALTAALKPSR